MLPFGVDPTKAVTKDLPVEAIGRSVVQFPSDVQSYPGATNVLIMGMSSVADQFTPWGWDVYKRDKELRDFWPSESYLAGAVYGVAASHAAFNWQLKGPARTVRAVQEMLHNANHGKGWQNFALKISVDMATQDNGAWAELVRAWDGPDAPVIGINHLDSWRSRRTGNPHYPIVYLDTDGRLHKMPWYTVLEFTDMPSPVETMFGAQYCAVTRILRMAQILRDVAVYKAEKVSGRFERAIHIVSGPAKKQIEDVMARNQEESENRGLTRFTLPVILASLDPERPVSHVEIPLASLPDNFDLDDELKWYIAAMALAFGRDYQDFAPLPGGNLGTSQQSEILHMKSRGKGPALFMKMVEHKFNFQGVIPRNVEFGFAEQDIEAEAEHAKLRRLRAETRKTQIESLEITPEVARQIAVDVGDLDGRYLELLGEMDVTPQDVAQADKRPQREGGPRATQAGDRAPAEGNGRPAEKGDLARVLHGTVVPASLGAEPEKGFEAARTWAVEAVGTVQGAVKAVAKGAVALADAVARSEAEEAAAEAMIAATGLAVTDAAAKVAEASRDSATAMRDTARAVEKAAGDALQAADQKAKEARQQAERAAQAQEAAQKAADVATAASGRQAEAERKAGEPSEVEVVVLEQDAKGRPTRLEKRGADFVEEIEVTGKDAKGRATRMKSRRRRR